MKTSAIIEGLTILQKYRNADSYAIGAEHDIIYAYETDMPLSTQDVKRMVKLGWFQEDASIPDEAPDYSWEHYDSDEGWAAYV